MLFSAWTWDPLVVALLSVAALLYAIGTRRTARTRLATWWQHAAFVAGWFTMVIAVLSPVHAISARLFSVHMTQHELLMLIAAPLFVISRPLVTMLWALPRAWRLAVGACVRTHVFSNIWCFVTGPLIAWLVHGAVVWAWHAPFLYEAALRDEKVHLLQHVMFFGSAGLFWWSLVHGRYGRMGYGVSVTYVFTTAMHTGLLGALITFAGRVWYPTYEGRTIPWGLTALEDQQIGGLIMWVPGGVVFTLVGLALFAAWLGEAERRVHVGASTSQGT